MLTREEFLTEFKLISNNYPTNVALYYITDLEQCLGISYFELDRLTNELSEYFSKLFGKNSQYIGISFSSSFFLPCFILALWKSGYCFAGIGSQYSEKDNSKFLNFLGVRYLVTDKKIYDTNDVFCQFSIYCRKFYIWRRELLGGGEEGERKSDGLENICYGIMTSGSTGEPKIIQVPWSCILANAVELSDVFQLTEFDCIFQASPCSFDPFFIELFMTFLKGCSLLIVSKVIKLHPSDLLRTLFSTTVNNQLLMKADINFKKMQDFFVNIQLATKKKVTILQMTPSIFRRWSDNEIQDILSPNSPLRTLILGGEIFPKEILKLKHPENKTRVFNIYGITEISCWAFLKDVTSHSFDADISIGNPLNDIMYRISESDELELGSNKRICFINQEKICQVEDAVFRKTGDIVKFVNKEIYYLNRSNQIVKKYGIKINLNKIEDSFKKKNKLIKECYCVFNEKSLKLGLFYVPANSKTNEMSYHYKTFEEFNEIYTVPEDELKCIEKPDYIIEMSKMVLNSHGKCDIHKLKSLIEQPHNSPGSDLTMIFTHLWIDTLGVKKVELSPLSFTELGGNSVLALSLISKLEDQGVNVPSNFITALLKGETFDECLKCLNECKIFSKEYKPNINISDVKFSIRWKFDLGKCVDATPAVFIYKGEERLVVGSHSSKLSCINSDSGEEIWTVLLGDRIESGFTPTRDGTKGFVGCYDHCVYCISTFDGSVIWKFKTGDMVKSTPCLSTNENIVYVGSYDKKLYCLSADEGQIRNSLQLSNGGIFCSGIVGDSLNSFFIGTLDGTCVAINQETNSFIWKTVLNSPIFASPCLIPEKPEILFSEVLGNVHCLNALNGTKMWMFKAGGNIYSSPIVETFSFLKYILFGCHDAYLYCLKYKEDLQLNWKQQLDSSIFSKPSITFGNASVCCASTKGFIYLCDFISGSIQTRLKLNGEIFSSAVYRNSRLFVGCRDNNVYSLDIMNKKISPTTC